MASGEPHMHGHGHEHGHEITDEKRLAGVALLTGAFMIAETVGGVLSGSLALLADAGHMLTDFASLALAWGAARVARRPADWKRTYGFDRFSVLAAFVNGLALFAIAIWIVIEAARRFWEPVSVKAGPMLIIAVAGLAVNVIAFLLLHRGDHSNLNLRSAALHVLGDLLGSAAAIVAALTILETGWTVADPLLSVLVVLLILGAAWRVVRDSGRILLEAAPEGVDVRDIADDLASLEGIDQVHHLHAWSIDEKRPMITLQVRLQAGASAEATRHTLRERLETRHGIDHATIEIENPEPAEYRTRTDQPHEAE